MEGSAELTSHTVFVKSIAYDVEKDALEEAFAAIGPVRNCFLVRGKGYEKHKGVGYVQFALREDAAQAVTQLHNSQLGSRKIKVEFANKRLSLADRKRKGEEQGTLPPAKAAKVTEHAAQPPKPAAPVAPAAAAARAPAPKPGISRQRQQELSKQQLVKTVAIGGIPAGRQQHVLKLVKAMAKVIHSELAPAEEAVRIAKLREDGCTDTIMLVTFDKVKHVMGVVAQLHGHVLSSPSQDESAPSRLWARQVSGEGAHHKQWRVIIRNLAFNVGHQTKLVDEQHLREALTPAGFVWDLTLARNADGKLRGFAFASFTSRAHAERAIALVNQQALEGRTVAVDWAIPKVQYQAAQGGSAAAQDSSALPKAPPQVDAAEAEAEQDDQPSDEEDGLVEEQPLEVERSRQLSVVDALLANGSDGGNKAAAAQEDAASYGSASEAGVAEMDAAPSAADTAPKRKQTAGGARSQAPQPSGQPANGASAPQTKQDRTAGGIDPELAELAARLAEGRPTAAQRDALSAAQQQRLQQRTQDATVFVRGLPAAATEAQLQLALSKFGPLKACRMVMDKVTGQPKGTAFAEYSHADSAMKAAAQGQAGQGEGVLVAGRNIVVHRALSKDDVRALALQQHPGRGHKDRRNLYLASEGEILEGSPAWEAVPPADRQRRIRAADEKKQKLRSPNFSVSRTRLAIRNIPASMTEPILKRVAIQAVKQHASQAQPHVKQVKILMEDKATGVISRGRGFVEFAEHEHALCALRQLNNNPQPFGSQHRPIVEFAIDDMQKLMKRSQRIQRQVHHVSKQEGEQERQLSRKPRQAVRKGKSQGATRTQQAA